uniref:Uncharacterized protein n=1 Tax=Pipistrellus kuhlii TaxID=59472 RepID=A0A7J7W3Q6_PIPKU|nr:hypothetical protein mPipKuh1_008128 [Pipistrellus kuhlii]
MILALEVTYPQKPLTPGKPRQLVTLIEIKISAICWMHDLEVKSFNLLVFHSRKLVLGKAHYVLETLVLEHSPVFLTILAQALPFPAILLKLPSDCLVRDPLFVPHHSHMMSEGAWPPDRWSLGNPQEFSDTVSGLKNKNTRTTAKGPSLLREHAVLSCSQGHFLDK